MTELNREYAVALYALAAENGAQDEYADGLRTVVAALEENPDYVDFLSCPAIPTGERLAALEEAFASVVHEHVLSFVQLLCERGRVSTIPACLKEYHLLLDEYHKLSRATVRYQVPLTQEEQLRLREKLEKISGHSVELVCEYDPTLIGGIVVEMDGRCIDGSLRRRLHEVKDVMNR
jgi:ATP synthase F1 delta subunit